LDNNTYVVQDDAGENCIIIDPSFESRSIWEQMQSGPMHVAAIVNTHAHIDHVYENAFFASACGAPLLIHSLELPILHNVSEQAQWFGIELPEYVAPARYLADGDIIAIGSEHLAVMHTPGHTPGGICLYGDHFIIAGDVLFAGSIGRTDLPGGDMRELLCSIEEKLLVLPDDTVVYPGHGAATSIGAEKRSNPYIGA
jgi:glyoxylase-like metal-dependent hydrolase (beta-lactamase superfamily II)